MPVKNPYWQPAQDFPPPETAHSLTVRDLLEARDLYHKPLSIMPHVIGTAVGLYRLRVDASGKLIDHADSLPRETKPVPRTLFTSRVTGDSQPAILVFVNRWIPYRKLPRDPRYIIPQYLYLRDGRAVPTCVIQLDLDPAVDASGADASRIAFPDSLIGGGCGVYTRVQGQPHVGTVACLVTDSERLYGLTSCHVVGPEKQPVYTRIRGKEERIGSSDHLQTKKKRFCELYPGYGTGDAVTCLDAGLIEIDQADRWTAQVLHLGELDDVADLHEANITLGMIGTPVRAAGAISGDRMVGEITALFPRYRGMGGMDYLGDVLIGPRFGQKKDAFGVAGGDSGSLWVLDERDGRKITTGAPRVKPVAITWGAIDFVGGGISRQLVLATLVSTICKALDVELVTRRNIGYRPVWGKENHRTLAAIVIGWLAASAGKLKEFLLGTGATSPEREAALLQLAVLPDDWRRKPGRDDEGPNHYADIDKRVGGQTLSRIAFTHERWLEFYQAWDAEEGNEVKRGALPFRIEQTFDYLVQYLREKKYDWAYAAAGALVHYVADACNPAHVTIWSKGHPDWTDSQHSRFHGIWDKEIVIDETQVRRKLRNARPEATIANGRAASVRALKLMKKTLKTVPLAPFVVPGDAPASYKKCRAFADRAQGRKKITDVVAQGCTLLLSLWESAWHLADGDNIDPQDFAGLDVTHLRDHVLWKPDFLPSSSLEEMAGQT